MFNPSLYSLSKYSLSHHHVPSTILGNRDSAANQDKARVLCHQETYVGVGEILERDKLSACGVETTFAREVRGNLGKKH